ncbi:SgcJ/EcaC family oxidoreductase [Paucibacter sp. APW11]|uniref:SgcJ/EcaC family oxidoreductase n=1 Tax=Roseateles aquae TaxID=3077235 RepID=A0ABU3PDP3_9BURK|nr:SgcJ/EcaC family oxidoreductase [Paucibacter sp. APW11]MDT9000711.1 SgcJ/EcaC family oxidoreductase [Paucibacter sp. APW11]
MKLRPPPLVLAALMACSTAFATPCDRAATESLLARIDAAWQARDSQAMAALYAPQASLAINAGAIKAQGREAVRKTFHALFAEIEAGNVHQLSLRLISEHGAVCVVDAVAAVGVPGDQQRFVGTYVLAEQAAPSAGLQILAARATEIR